MCCLLLGLFEFSEQLGDSHPDVLELDKTWDVGTPDDQSMCARLCGKNSQALRTSDTKCAWMREYRTGKSLVEQCRAFVDGCCSNLSLFVLEPKQQKAN